jgi:hypothetical protein
VPKSGNSNYVNSFNPRVRLYLRERKASGYGTDPLSGYGTDPLQASAGSRERASSESSSIERAVGRGCAELRRPAGPPLVPTDFLPRISVDCGRR